MRAAATIGLALLLALSGCGAPILGGDSTPTTPGTDAPGMPAAGTPPPPPETDVLGWEDGYWHNATLDVDNSDGLNESERAAVVARAKARVEYVRRLEFNGSVNISVISRANFSAARDDNTSEALRQFDNAKFEALFLIGGDTDSIETQEDTRNASVAGYYSHERNAIVVVSDSATPTFESERTLAHELVHALQDQHLGLGDRERAGSRDAHNGRNGLIEGDPTTVQYAYLDRCGEAWSCIEAPANGTDGAGGAENASTPHLGVYLLQFFPYSDGPDFVATLRDGDGWAGVNAAYEHPPESATEVIYPDRYRQFQVREVDLADDLRDGWERVRPPDRLDHARIGQSGLAAMFAYTLYDDYNRSALLAPQELLNFGPGGLNETDPINYDLAPVRGWTGDRMHVYARGDDLAYRWRLTWESAAAAQRFAARYRGLLQHWGGRPGGGGLWRVPPDSPFTGAYHLSVRDDTVTIAHADTAGQLADVSPAAR